ncbi:armadillo-type protein [Pilobolus umbonatus]|nr:armadillo-type protein [Pilobolus umbonatus]
MALNDLMNELQKNYFSMEPVMEGKIVQAVLALMDDKNSEVQNLAVRCLGPLVKQIKEDRILEVIDCLSQFATDSKNEELRSIASVGMKTVITEINYDKSYHVCNRIIPKLLHTIQNMDCPYEMQMDTLDILSEVLSRFGSLISTEQYTEIQSILVPLLYHSRAAVRKRASVAIGYLVVHINDDLFNQLFEYLMSGLRNKSNSNDKIRTLIQCSGVLSRYSTARLGKHLPALIKIIIEYTLGADEDDELREICLQAMESFILRCPTEISPFIDEIGTIALSMIKYDPNFAEEDDEESGEEMDEEEDNEEEEDDEYDDIVDYSDDDDDMSWKVRRSASKVLAAIIETRSDLLQQMYKTVAPVLISRFKEREESVRVDILQTFIILLRQTNVYGNNVENFTTRRYSLSAVTGDNDEFTDRDASSKEATDGSRQLLRNQVPKLCRALSKQLYTKSTQTRQIGFHLLHEIINVLHGGLADQIEQFIPVIEASLSNVDSDQHAASSSNLKIEILSLLRAFFHYHPSQFIYPSLGRFAPIVIQSTSDKFYKIKSEAFLVCIELIRAIRPIDSASSTVPEISEEYASFILQIYQITLEILNTNDADQEVKERSIMCLGITLAQASDILGNAQIQAWNVLLDRLRNEVTRLITVKTLTVIAQSPLVTGSEVQKYILTAIDEIALLLRKSNRPLRIASLECLAILLNRYGSFISTTSYTNLLKELKPLISDSDLHLLPLALNTVASILKANSDCVNDVKMFVLPILFQLIQSPLLQGAALDSLLSMFAAFAKASPNDYQSLINGLVNPLLEAKTSGVSAGGVAAVANKQAASTVAQIAAILAVNTNGTNRDNTIRQFQSYIKDFSKNDSIKYLSLLTIGEIGRRIDLTYFPDIHNDVMQLFSAQSEEVKFAAAFALGNICVGNIYKYLPMIVTHIKEQPKRRYLLLHALKEIITRYDHKKEQATSLNNAADEIWVLLLESSEDGQEEGTRTVVAECIGKLALTNPAKFLSQLENLLTSNSACVRATVATAIKYAVVDPAKDYDELLKPIMQKFINLLQDSDLNVRRLALVTINSAIHRKPYIVSGVLSQLIPLLYEETIIKEELIHTVEMGPFKHKVDDGLEIRKAAFECMYTLLSTCLNKIDIHAFLERVRSGLDDQHDIKMLVYLMLIRLAKVAPTAVAQKLDDLISPFKTTLDFKMRSNAVKQEVEKNQELIRAALRCIHSLSALSDSNASPRFEMFVFELKNGPLAEEYKLTVLEAESRENRNVEYMELS